MQFGAEGRLSWTLATSLPALLSVATFGTLPIFVMEHISLSGKGGGPLGSATADVAIGVLFGIAATIMLGHLIVVLAHATQPHTWVRLLLAAHASCPTQDFHKPRRRAAFKIELGLLLRSHCAATSQVPSRKMCHLILACYPGTRQCNSETTSIWQLALRRIPQGLRARDACSIPEVRPVLPCSNTSQGCSCCPARVRLCCLGHSIHTPLSSPSASCCSMSLAVTTPHRCAIVHVNLLCITLQNLSALSQEGGCVIDAKVYLA